MERIQAQLRERIEEAVEMAALKLMVDLRAASGRPAPETTSAADRAEFEARLAGPARAAARRVRGRAAGGPARRRFDEAETAAGDEPARLLAGQVCLARRLPDYWQRFERYQRQYAEQRLADPAGPGVAQAAFRLDPGRAGASAPSLRRPATAQRSSHSSSARVHSA